MIDIKISVLSVPGNSDAVEQAVGIIGAVVMPHNVYHHLPLLNSVRWITQKHQQMRY